MHLKLSPKQIAKVKFSGVEKGYDPLEVDEYLDQIIEDYQQIAPLLKKMEEQEKMILSQSTEIARLKDELSDAQTKIKDQDDARFDLEAELSFEKSRVENALKKFHELGEVDTLLFYLNYISSLETELTALGGDIRKCKATCNRKASQIAKKK